MYWSLSGIPDTNIPGVVLLNVCSLTRTNEPWETPSKKYGWNILFCLKLFLQSQRKKCMYHAESKNILELVSRRT